MLPAATSSPLDEQLMAALTTSAAAFALDGPLALALEASTSGTTVCDARLPDTPVRDGSRSLAGRVETLARTDALTGLLNRWVMTEALEIALRDARARGEHPVVALCDVDGFRGVDQEHGQAVGDAVLAEVAVSVGFAVHPAQGGDTSMLSRAAEAAMRASRATPR